MRRIALWIAACGATAAAGCATVAVAPVEKSAPAPAGGELVYSRGKATQIFSTPPDQVRPAVLAALDDLKIHSPRQSIDAGTLMVEATTADGRGVLVTLRAGRGGSRLTARVGWFGDEPLSRALMERVGVRLGTLPPAPIPSEPPSSPAGNPYFSRSAVPDAVMLRDQAEARYRDAVVP